MDLAAQLSRNSWKTRGPRREPRAPFGQGPDMGELDPDCGQGEALADALAEPLMARAALPDRTRNDDVADSVWRAGIRDALRFRRP